MGCGSSNSLDVPSGPSDYKYMVQQTWDKVGKTVDKMNGQQRKLVVKRSGWKTVRIFVSSTFKDFHAEREVLVKEVFTDMRTWCEKRRIHLVDCDLRWGVPQNTTSEETLRTCLGEIDRCYQDNIMPFFLNLTSERCGWIPTSHDVPESLSKEYQWVHGLSVTEMEILHGAYRIDNPNSLFMIRNQSFLSSLPEEFRDEFVDPNPIAPHKMEVLKHMLKSRLGNRVHWYDVEYAGVDDDGKVELSGLQDSFSKMVYDFFKTRIEEQYPLLEANLDPYQQTKEAHESFLKSRGGIVLGRNNILEQIQMYVTDVGVDKALVLSGGAGSGKSSIMARIADVAQTMALNKRIPGGGDTGWHVFYHFVGAIPGSTDLEQCLKRLLKELNAFNAATMPKNLEACCQLACGVLSNPKTPPVIVIIDALNQFDDDKTNSVLSWLPRKLSSQVRVILAMIDDTPPHKELHERAIKPQEILVTPLDMSARQQIVTEMLAKYNKKLDDGQMASLLSKESSQNPLWLSIACEELRVFGLFAKVTDKINNLADGLFELLEQVFSRFEEENGGMLLVATLCLLECSATGLLETELLLILGDEDNLMPSKKNLKWMSTLGEKRSEKSYHDMSPLPAAKWAVVYRALKPFIRPFGDSGEGRLDFYHRALSKAVRKKYFSQNGDQAKLWWHKKLTDFFSEVKSTPRKVEELPVHMIAIQDIKGLGEFLTGWDVFDALYSEDYSSLLLKYWNEGRGKSGADDMLQAYQNALQNLINEGAPRDEVALRYEQVGRVMTQAGKFKESYNLLETAISIEREELGARPERMVELYSNASFCFDEICRTLYNFSTKEQLKDRRPAIDFARKSIAIRETLPGEMHKFKLGGSLIKLSFMLSGWKRSGGDNTMTGEEAITEANKHVEKAIQIFTELGSQGQLADCLMTKGIVSNSGADTFKLYMEAHDLCVQAYGEYSVLGCRLALNTAIHLEDERQLTQAYEYFVKWKDICEVVFGRHHPKTKRCYDTLAEPRYVSIARQVANQIKKE